ncbi:MAG: hypothetical protein Q8L97_10045 [Nitrosomonas sp.]|nr:hypothetical protein [Nitrosomonas sp.]MDP1550484.1 hypothetical protein [Nitrosomonas sp.]
MTPTVRHSGSCHDDPGLRPLHRQNQPARTHRICHLTSIWRMKVQRLPG